MTFTFTFPYSSGGQKSYIRVWVGMCLLRRFQGGSFLPLSAAGTSRHSLACGCLSPLRMLLFTHGIPPPPLFVPYLPLFSLRIPGIGFRATPKSRIMEFLNYGDSYLTTSAKTVSKQGDIFEQGFPTLCTCSVRSLI